jgi:hypothetical protein
MCDAAFRSSPRILFQLITGDFPNFDSTYRLRFKLISKVPFRNMNTFRIESLDDLYFYSGTKVSASSCIENIVLYEYTMSQFELDRIENESIKKHLRELERLESKKQKQIEKANAELINYKNKTYDDIEVSIAPSFKMINGTRPNWFDSITSRYIEFVIDTIGKAIWCDIDLDLNEINKSIEFQPAQIEIMDNFYKVKSRRKFCFSKYTGSGKYICGFIYRKKDRNSKIIKEINTYEGYEEFYGTDYNNNIDTFMLKFPKGVYEISIRQIKTEYSLSVQTISSQPANVGRKYYQTNCLFEEGFEVTVKEYLYSAQKSYASYDKRLDLKLEKARY